jgi:hypothetical protein
MCKRLSIAAAAAVMATGMLMSGAGSASAAGATWESQADRGATWERSAPVVTVYRGATWE